MTAIGSLALLVGLEAQGFASMVDADAASAGSAHEVIADGADPNVGGGAQGREAATRGLTGDSAAVAEAVHRFHAALEAGDSVAALGLLAEHAMILESGGVETKEEYRSHHLPADIAFARAVPREAGPVRVTVRGDVAWTTSTSTVRGTYRDRQIHSRGVELMVLERSADGWRIAAIHWSSRAVSP